MARVITLWIEGSMREFVKLKDRFDKQVAIMSGFEIRTIEASHRHEVVVPLEESSPAEIAEHITREAEKLRTELRRSTKKKTE